MDVCVTVIELSDDKWDTSYQREILFTYSIEDFRENFPKV